MQQHSAQAGTNASPKTVGASSGASGAGIGITRSSSRGGGKKSQKGGASGGAGSAMTLFSTIAWVAPVILLFFFVGVYVGSQIMHDMDMGASSDAALGGPMFAAVGGGVGGTGAGAGASIGAVRSEAVAAPVAVVSTVRSVGSAGSAAAPRSAQAALRGAIDSINKASGDTAPAPVPVAPAAAMQVQQQQAPPAAPAPISSSSSEAAATGSDGELDATWVRSALRRMHPMHVTSPATYFQGPKDLAGCSSELLLGAWVYLDEGSPGESDMRTVFSNKASGCGPANGISLFINAWQSSDHQLYTEYGNSVSGCNKLGTKGISLPNKKWFHVAVLHSNNAVALYLDGRMVAQQTAGDEGGYQPHTLQRENALYVGQFEGNAFPLYGNVSHLAVVDAALAAQNADSGYDGRTPESAVRLVQRMMLVPNHVRSVPGLHALLPLDAQANEIFKPEVAAAAGPDGKKKRSPGIAAIYRPKAANPSDTLPRIGVYASGFAGSMDGSVTSVSEGGMNTGLGPDHVVTDEMRAASDVLARVRREKVKGAMQHAWAGYTRYAWGFDELKPLSHRGQNNWGGMGVTLVDSLDTLWVMGMKKEFNQARDWVRDKLSFDAAGSVSVFETTIRELGGLLSAYDFSKEKVFLDKAEILGKKLLGAFDTPSGIARSSVNMRTGQGGGGWSGGAAILSELGTLQLEFRYLAHHLGDKSMEDKAMKGIQLMAKKATPNGLYPIKININDGNHADSMITFGALGDSFYEYLLKMWLQGDRKEAWLRAMYDRAMDGAISVLLKKSTPSGLAFLSDFNGRQNLLKMDHLVCFMPGLLALGAYTDPHNGDEGLEAPRAKRDLLVAKALMHTCYQMYHRQNSGIAPEYVEFRHGSDMVVGPSAPFYILRPETAESLFILHQLTGDPIYRDWSFEIFEAIERNCRTDAGYGALRDVTIKGGGVDDRMESFFLAETLKYLYLVQDPDNTIDLRKRYVINTEAHPLTMFSAEAGDNIPHTPTTA